MTTIPLAEARANLSRLIDEAVRTHERTEITRNGTRAAVLLGADDYDSMLETLESSVTPRWSPSSSAPSPSLMQVMS
jgi:prevent-host-death family protein